MTGWNLPPGCTDRDIDEAAGVYDEMEDRPSPEDERAEAWEYWHERANKFEALNHDMLALIKDLQARGLTTTEDHERVMSIIERAGG